MMASGLNSSTAFPISAPDYVESATSRYRLAERDHAHRAIELAASIVEWQTDMTAHGGLKKEVRKVVRDYLVANLKKSGSFASRILGLAELIPVLEQAHLPLSNIRSEGILFALVDAARGPHRKNRTVELAAMVADTATLTIDAFRKRWLPASRRRRQPLFDVTEVCSWLENDATAADIQIVSTTLSRLTDFASSQISI